MPRRLKQLVNQASESALIGDLELANIAKLGDNNTRVLRRSTRRVVTTRNQPYDLGGSGRRKQRQVKRTITTTKRTVVITPKTTAIVGEEELGNQPAIGQV